MKWCINKLTQMSISNVLLIRFLETFNKQDIYANQDTNNIVHPGNVWHEKL